MQLGRGMLFLISVIGSLLKRHLIRVTLLGAPLSWSCSDTSCMFHRRSWNVTIES